VGIAWADLQALVLAFNLPEPEYSWVSPGGHRLLLAFPEQQAGLADGAAEVEGWTVIPCAGPDELWSAGAALARLLGCLPDAELPASAEVAAAPARPSVTEQQRRAIEHAGGPARILAGAGTGKTTVIVRRFHYLLNQGVAPDRILVLTFSREAARALREAVVPDIPAAARLWISTFHSFCLKVLTEEGEAGLRLIPEGEQQVLVEPEALTFIGQAKDYLLTPDDVERYAASTANNRLLELAEIYRQYQAALNQQAAADFPDFIARAVQLLESQPAVAARWQQRFEHILVDEFQDTNLAQYRVLRVLSREHRNLMVVGDDDQAIYHFRGASDRYLLRMAADYPDLATYVVEQNFRCPPAVLGHANQLIKGNGSEREAKRLTTARDGKGDPPVQTWEAQTEREEAEAVAAEIAGRIERGEAPAGDFAILCRSLRRTGGEFARALTRRSVPCRMVGAEQPHPAVHQTLALLRLTRGIATADLLPVLANKLAPADLCAAVREGRGDLSLLLAAGAGPEAFRTAGADLTAWLDEHKGRPLPELMWAALRYLGQVRLTLTPTPADVERLAAARTLQERAAAADTLEGLLASFATGDGQSRTAAGDAVTLMTVHAAKGLEFPVVFVTGLAEGLFPVAVDTAPVFYTAEAIRDWVDQGGAAAVPDAAQRLARHIREERRLAYVALTRARQELILTRARKYGQEDVEPSRFLAEMGAPPAAPVAGRLADPLPDARAYLVRAAGGAEPPVAERVAEAVRVLGSHPLAVPLRRQQPPVGGGAPLRLSATALETYRECPRRYWYAQVLKLPEEDSIALAFGDGMHKALERFHKAMQAGRSPAWGNLEVYWQECFDRSRCQSELQYRQLLDRGRSFLRRYHSWAEGRWRRIIGVEEWFDVPYTDAAGQVHQLVGKYDLVAEDRDATVHIIDFKTGKRDDVVNKRPTKGSAKNPDQKLQLGLYYLARSRGQIMPDTQITYIFLRHGDDRFPDKLTQEFNAKNDQVVGFCHTAETLAGIRAMTDEIIAGILAGRFDRVPEKCERCPFQGVCEVSPDDWF